MGGFGNVYIADFNGINTAAKIVNFTSVVDDSTQDQEMLDDSRLDQKSRRRAAVARAKRAAAKERTENRELAGFLRELEAIKRLRSPRTVQIFGAVTAPRDRVVLVMELLPGGDLRYRLRRSRRPLDDGTLRGIVTDICSGMAFLHGEAFVHGDLKSSNVLFDAAGRAKVSPRFFFLSWKRPQGIKVRISCKSARNGGNSCRPTAILPDNLPAQVLI